MKYEVSGFIRVKAVVEADSAEEAIETALEVFDKDKHVSSDEEPEFDVANPIGKEEEDLDYEEE